MLLQVFLSVGSCVLMIIELLERLASSCLLKCAAICGIAFFALYAVNVYIAIAVAFPAAPKGNFA